MLERKHLPETSHPELVSGSVNGWKIALMNIGLGCNRSWNKFGWPYSFNILIIFF